ncbi:IucA/IucC family protein [Tuberibacillus sp. Marseille-P3662]|uniref:IucA/IucC family protein n=1 Tax=Tuberibacillus sp. Marseille-P3662 TaxID=1965358 RepID=UPI000A1CCC7D|nr:IucA/IucC family protein [Tuberibacillus sp. Marseille-P3662]
MTSAKTMAEQATMQSFLNCYLREHGSIQTVSIDYLSIDQPIEQIWQCPLKSQGICLTIPVRYVSLTGAHLFAFPIYMETRKGDRTPLDYVTLVTLLTKELLNYFNRDDSEDELILRVIHSCRNIQYFIDQRLLEKNALTAHDFSFIEAEQSLIFGHLLHPTPKSRQGMDEDHLAPELKGHFQLDYFKADASIVAEDSALGTYASQLIKEQLLNDKSIQPSFKEKYGTDNPCVLIPAHPFQATFLLKQPHVKKLMDKGLLEYLGPNGQAYTATSSIRTVYNKQASAMYKFSLNVQITNSLRVNKRWELDRGVEVSRLMSGYIGADLKRHYPKFSIIQDPAYITIETEDQEETGFEVILRDNPFKNNDDKNVTLIAGLTQPHMTRDTNRLGEIIRHLANEEGRPTSQVSRDWFQQYLDCSLKPMLWLFGKYGIALEAHQQNSLIKLEQGYPAHFYYRDNQGYYFCESSFSTLQTHLSNLNEKSDTVCPDHVAEERFRYYCYVNQLLGMINAFGRSGVCEESVLLQALANTLKGLEGYEAQRQSLIASLLNNRTLPSKGNLLTRLNNMDELVGALETQSVYTDITNPLYEVRTANV